MNRLHFSAPLPVSETHCDPSTEISLSLFEDILNASLLTAATASIANRISSHHPLPPPLTALVSCLPPLPISYSAVMARRRTMPQEAETVAALREFVEGLTAARDFAQLVSLSGLRSRNSLPTGITILAADWRQVALLALILVDKLEATVGVEIPEPLTARAELAVGLLAAVCRGESPCVSGSGRLCLPEPFERRSAPRSQSGHHALFALHGGMQRALVVNVSQQGVCVLGLSGGERGDPIALVMGSGQRASGRIAWLDGDQAGVRFDNPLASAIFSSLTD